VLTCEVRKNLPTLNGIEIPSLFIINQGELAQMEFMKAAVLTAFGDAEKFEIQTVPTPTLMANQVLVRVCATSINPIDYQTRRGDYKELVRLPAILGVDVSGVIEAIGEAVTDFKVGDNAGQTHLKLTKLNGQKLSFMCLTQK
jgi:NADPH:quinone reductase